MIAFSRAHGVPARVGNVPGRAEVDLHLFDGEKLVPTGEALVVFNLASESIEPNKWLMLTKMGEHWFVDFEDCVCP